MKINKDNCAVLALHFAHHAGTLAAWYYANVSDFRNIDATMFLILREQPQLVVEAVEAGIIAQLHVTTVRYVVKRIPAQWGNTLLSMLIRGKA